MLRRGTRLLVGLIISGGALYYFLLVSPSGFWSVALANGKAVLLAFLVLIPAYLARALKYQLILQRHSLNVFQVAAAQYAGIALNNVLPFRMGDVLRTVFINRVMNVPFWAAVSSLVIERAFDLLFLLIFFGIFFLGFYLDNFFDFLWPFLIFLGLVVGAVALCILIISTRPVLSERFNSILKQVYDLWQLSLMQTARVGLLCCVQWILEIFALAIVLSVYVFGKVELASIVSAFASNFSTLVPSTPGYIGTFEAAGILPFRYAGGVDMQKAASFVILLHFSIWSFSTLLGVVSMLILPQLRFYLGQNAT
jgi:uncharacterized membrane protein YbhN (UPF0104 family)